MKFWSLITLSIVFLTTFSGCGGSTPAPKENTVIDTSLPIVEFTKNGVISDMNSIAFEWKSISNPRVEGVYIYKKVATEANSTNKLHYYTTINSRFKTHFVDTDIQPDTKYFYAFSTYAKDVQSKLSTKIVVNSLPVLQSISWIHSINGMPRVAKIIWRPHNNQKVKEYIIERKTFEDKEWKEIDRVEGRLNAEYIDSDLKDNYTYMYRIRVVTYDGIVSLPSQSVKVVTKALPQSVNNIKTSINLPRRIEIHWDATQQKDFAFYYLYRSEEVDGSYELIATLHNNKYTNKIEEDGKIYFYRVSVVDKDGLESVHDKHTVEGMTLIKPKSPVITQARLIGSKIEITWKNIDTRVISYSLVQIQKKGWFDTSKKRFDKLQDARYVENDVSANSTYTYIIYGVDTFGIESEPSINVKVVVPESTQIRKGETNMKLKEQRAPEMKKSKESIIKSDNIDLSGL